MPSKNKPLTICNETIYPGEQLKLALPLPEIYSCAPLHMPIKIINGKLEGPCVLVIAAMNGNEINGTEIIHRLYNHKSVKQLRGTLIMIPVMNVYGLMTKSPLLPGNIEFSKCFPGSKNGNLGSRMAHLFTHEIFAKADICIDLQTGSMNYFNLPQVYVNLEDSKSKELALLFNAPVILNDSPEKGTLKSCAAKQHIPYLRYEAGEAQRFDEYAIKSGLRGLMNVLQGIGMLPNKKKADTTSKSFIAEKTIWVRSTTSGISHSKLKLGEQIKKNDTLCIIKDPFDTTPATVIKSPEAAIIVGMNNLPLVHEGEGLYQLAIFPKMKQAVSALESWHEETSTDGN